MMGNTSAIDYPRKKINWETKKKVDASPILQSNFTGLEVRFTYRALTSTSPGLLIDIALTFMVFLILASVTADNVTAREEKNESGSQESQEHGASIHLRF